MTGNKRDYYRIEFPVDFRPELIVKDQSFAVLDLSEQGMRILAEQPSGLKPEVKIGLLLNFPDGSYLKLEGKVLRETNREVAMFLITPVPLTKIMELQRELLKKYKGKA